MFTHLHVHSHYSLLTALPKIEELLQSAKDMGMTALALTDTSALYGAVEFYSAAKKYGIKPIIGAEMFVCKDLRSKNNTTEDRRRHQIVLLVKNEAGYKNLLKIISTAQLEGFYYKARTDKELLKKHAEGLIALSGSLQGEVPSELIYGNYERAKRVALEYQDIFGKGNFYLELGPNVEYDNQVAANQGLIQISRETGIPLVAACDVHYVKKEHAEIQDVLLCIRDNKKVTDTERFSMKNLDLSLRTPAEMAELFKDVPEAVTNTQKIVDACEFVMRFGESHLPQFPLPAGTTPDAYLRTLCESGLIRRYGDKVNEEHRKRMDYELDVIEKTGFASYFLIVQDFVNWAKNNRVVVGPGRGSAAGSLVAYLTGITNIDPIEFNLLFERFLNPERISMPDVDMDFSDDRRDDVLNYVREKYGHDHVAQIITFGTMAARGSVRDVGRALGVSYEFCDKTSKMIPMFTSIKDALAKVPEFRQHYASSDEAKRLIDTALSVEGLCRHASMHACGVVITKDPVTEYTPLQRVGGAREGVVTQYAASTKSNAVEKIGLLKMDFLGLKNLTIIQNTLRIVRKIKDENIDIEKIPLDDASTFRLLQETHTTGVFQLESTGMKRYLKQLKPTVFEDIIAMVALYRPGPMDWIPDFIDGKHGKKKIAYLHPALEPILQNTYGVAVYQEQVMQIARDLAGFTLGEADVLRKAMGKKIKELIAGERIKFIDGAATKGVKREVAEKVFSFIEPFAGYGFNRSHAACYALIGYQTAYLKAHYPAEFMAALLTSDQNDIDRIAIEIREATEMGMVVLPPHINESFCEFAVIIGEDQKERIRFGLSAIKNVGQPVAEEIVRERQENGKYQTLEDFVERIKTKDLNKKSLEALIKVGAFEGFGERNELLQSIDAMLRHSKNIKSLAGSHENSLFGAMPIVTGKIKLAQASAIDKTTLLAWEKELLGLYVSDHPVGDYAEYFSQVATPILDLEKKPEGSSVRVGGVIIAVRKILTKNQSTMYFVTLEDLTSRIEALVFGRTAERTEGLWVEGEIVMIDAHISHKNGSLKCVAEDVKRVGPADIKQHARIAVTRLKNDRAVLPETLKENISPLVITLSPDAPPQCLEKLSQFLREIPSGSRKVAVKVNNAMLETSFSLDPNEEHLVALQKLHGVQSIA